MEHTRGLLVHEWIEKNGGAENVLDQFSIAFPGAPIACLWSDAPERYPSSELRESPLARTWLRHRKAASVPVMPFIWRGRWAHQGSPEWIVSSSHSFAHHVAASRAARGARTFAYVHTPARYLWAREHDPRGTNPAARALAPGLRRWDRRRAQLTERIAANSEFVRSRIRRAWDRDATVIYPPVSVETLLAVEDWTAMVTSSRELALLDSLPATFILGASRLVEYKRLDAVILAGEAAGLPVVIAGAGPDEPRLRELGRRSGVPVIFAGRVTDELMRALMQLALVYVFPPVEDFGIMPVEAMALGTPAVVNAAGGAGESVGRVGLGTIVEELDRQSLARAVAAAADIPITEGTRAGAANFSERRFRSEITTWINGDHQEETVNGRTNAGRPQARHWDTTQSLARLRPPNEPLNVEATRRAPTAPASQGGAVRHVTEPFETVDSS